MADLKYITNALGINRRLSSIRSNEMIGTEPSLLRNDLVNLIGECYSQIEGKPEKTYLKELTEYYSTDAARDISYAKIAMDINKELITIRSQELSETTMGCPDMGDEELTGMMGNAVENGIKLAIAENKIKPLIEKYQSLIKGKPEENYLNNLLTHYMNGIE
jgi:hypothetical protein